MATLTSRRRRFQKHIGSIGIMIIALSICCFGAVAVSNLKRENRGKEKKIETLNQQISEEEDKKAELKAYEKEVKSRKFIEEMARKIGLIYEDEILFMPED